MGSLGMAVIALQEQRHQSLSIPATELKPRGLRLGSNWVILNPALQIPCEGNLVRLSFQLL